MRGRRSTVIAIAILWAALLGFVIVIAKRQTITDWVILRGYDPPAEIAVFTNTTSMSEEGRKLFYVHDPRLLDAGTFKQRCESTEQSIVLGCFDGRGIYIFDVKDDRLVGVEDVTAAHEMLHAAYERLSKTEKEEVDAQLIAVAKTITNKRLLDLFESYRSKDESQYPNELHSIIGTEVADLPQPLEIYYSRYFTNRQRVVGLAVAYEKVFSDLKNQVEALDASLSLRKSEIDKKEAELSEESDRLTNQRNELQRLADNGDTTAYNNLVPVYNNAVNIYNAHLASVKQLIAEYNEIVAERNKIVVTQNDLVHSLDSSAAEEIR